VKLLFDQNVSPDLVRRLGDLFPGSEHVYNLNLHEVDDPVLWSFARENHFIVVSKDADFSELSMIRGFPPKLLWLRLGNCRTSDVEDLIRSNYEFVAKLVEDEERGILSLFAKSAG
jgi:predicted nuclease of predicted toxin-antitoxin system